MAARIEYKASVARDLRKLAPAASLRALDQLEKALSKGGQSGQPLTREYAGLFRLRVGDYRIIYARTEEGCLVLRIGHRREVCERDRPEL